MSMFCHQCQETLKNKGCTFNQGMCGKRAEVANLQDLYIWTLKGISVWGVKANELGIYDEETAYSVAKGLFTTITNANFDKYFFIKAVKEAILRRNDLRDKYCKAKGDNCSSSMPECATWEPTNDAEIEAKAESGTGGWLEIKNEDIRSLKATVLYGLKGISAYLEHGYQIIKGGKDIFLFLMEGLSRLVDDSITQDDLLALVIKTGEHGVKVMKYLDEANAHYGDTEITEVNTGVGNNPGILISGHDLVDLEDLLEQTKGEGVDVYSHSEMLPAHYRPFFKKYKNFIGNYGNAWYLQTEEIEKFHGPVFFTSNCLVPPDKADYIDRIFTSGPVGFEGCVHIPDRPKGGRKDFSTVIAKAKTCRPPEELENGKIVGGFGHKQVLSLADKIITAVKSGDIKRFIVMGGCDGRHKTRQYYTDVAKKLPKDTIILTAGCAKYKYIKEDLGDIAGIPRVLDAGQCNDSYSLAVIAMELQKAFELNDINDLPLSFDIAWYEQKAVIVLLALLSLGVKGIRLGPTLPGFLSPNVASIIIEKFNLRGISTPEEDVEAMLAGN